MNDLYRQDSLRATSAELLVLRAESLLEGIDGSLGARAPDAEIERRLDGFEGTVWRRLVELFGLSPPEADLLALAVAVASEPALGPKVAAAQGMPDTLLPTESLVKRLHGHSGHPIYRPASPLSVYRLLHPARRWPGEAWGFESEPRLVDWLFGTLTLDAPLLAAVRPADQPASAPVPPEWPVEATAARLGRALEAGGILRLVIEGRPGTGRHRFATAVAHHLSRTALLVDGVALEGDDFEDRFLRLQRFGLVANVGLIWRGGTRAWPRNPPLAPLQMICVAPESQVADHPDAADLWCTLPEPSRATKAAAWSRWVPHLESSGAELASIPGVTLGDLWDTARTAPRDLDDARRHLRTRGRRRLVAAGDLIEPQYDWADLVLPDETLEHLRRIAFEAQARPSLADHDETRRLFSRSLGLGVLFSGPPGVGKSMATDVIAKDLGISLLRIDLAATTSKWVGETAKNLSAAFAAAKSSGAALLFEEADALFTKRSDVKDANDRYANADTNHLLHLLEVSNVRAFLTTNRRSSIDAAFIRRLDHVVEFPRPGFLERQQLWRAMLRGLDIEIGPEAVVRLAEAPELSPAQIKNAVLGAWLMARQNARPPAPSDLDRAVAHELVKEGRAPLAGEHSTRRRLRSES